MLGYATVKQRDKPTKTKTSMEHGVEVKRENEFSGEEVKDVQESKEKVTLVQESAHANGRSRSSRNIRVVRDEKKKQKVNFGGTLSTGEARDGPLPLPAGITSRYLRIVSSKIEFKDVKPVPRMILSLSVLITLCAIYNFTNDVCTYIRNGNVTNIIIS